MVGDGERRRSPMSQLSVAALMIEPELLKARMPRPLGSLGNEVCISGVRCRVSEGMTPQFGGDTDTLGEYHARGCIRKNLFVPCGAPMLPSEFPFDFSHFLDYIPLQLRLPAQPVG